MLLYEDEENRAEAAAYWINQGLEEGQLVSMLLSMPWTNRIC
jgi:hypothetical protein